MTSSRYHREQAQVFAALALNTRDRTQADQFKLAAIEHLERAQETESDETWTSPVTPPK